jgi:alpha,alpha-trehalase
MFVQMLNLYVQETGNTTILTEALPLADIEMKWWATNRSIEVTSPWTNQTHTVYHYNVFVNTAPRPEGYLEDYETAMGASPALNQTEREALYIELASGAESGWDYSVRWAKERIINLEDQFPILRKLGVVATIPVDLTSLMRGNHALVRDLELLSNWTDNTASEPISSIGQFHRQQQHYQCDDPIAISSRSSR